MEEEITIIITSEEPLEMTPLQVFVCMEAEFRDQKEEEDCVLDFMNILTSEDVITMFTEMSDMLAGSMISCLLCVFIIVVQLDFINTHITEVVVMLMDKEFTITM